jgi:PAS domain S-box-containing protein
VDAPSDRAEFDQQEIAVAQSTLSNDDIEQRGAEAGLALYLDVANNIPIGLAILKLDVAEQADSLRILRVNPAAQRIFGRPAAYFVGRRLIDVYPQVVGDDLLPLLRNVVVEQRPQELRERFFADAQGWTGHLTLRCFPLPEACLGVAFEDVTSQKVAEEALRASEERFRSVAETAQEAIIAADEDGRIIFWNQAAETTFGHAASEMLGQPITPLMPERFREGHRRGIARLDSSGTGRLIGRTVEMRGLTKEGREFPMEISLSRWTAGGQTFSTAIIRDVSSRRQARQDLVEAHRRLADSDEMARTHLARELHDGPLQDIVGVRLTLGALAAKAPDPVSSAALTAAQMNLQAISDRLRAMCQELRPPALAQFGLDAAIRSHAQRFRDQHPGVALALELDKDSQRLSERTRYALYRIYRQSLDNVAHHAQAGQVHVKLTLEDQFATLTVRDDGRGFELPHNWLEFARRGHLGLLGSAERAQSVGGRFKVLAAPGRGTEVKVSVPIATSPELGIDADESSFGIVTEAVA